MPSNLCKLFWSSAASIPCLVVTWPWAVYHLIFDRKDPQHDCAIGWKFLLMGAWCFSAIVTGNGYWGFKSLSVFLWGLWTLPLGLAIVLTVVFSMVYFFKEILPKWLPKKEKKYWSEKTEKKPNIVIEYIKAKKKKLCPMIEWQR